MYKTPTVAQYSELATEMMKESNLIVESFLYSLNSENLTVTSGWDEEPLPENNIPLTNNTTWLPLAIFGDEKLVNFKCVVLDSMGYKKC